MQQHPNTHPRPLWWGPRSNIFFSESSCVAHQIRREGSIEHHASTYSALTRTLDPLGWVKDQNMLFSESSRVAYQIKWDGA